MGVSHRVAFALGPAVLLLLGVGLVGVGPLPNRLYRSDVSNARYISDLSSGNVNRRLYAAKVLRNRARYATRVYDRGDPESVAYDEALATLEELDGAVEACVSKLDDERVAPICADLLGVLQADRAREALLQAIGAKPGTRLARHARKAVELIDAADAGTSSPTDAPTPGSSIRLETPPSTPALPPPATPAIPETPAVPETPPPPASPAP